MKSSHDAKRRQQRELQKKSIVCLATKQNKQTNNFSSAAQTVAWAGERVDVRSRDYQMHKFMIEFEKNICNVIKRLISLLLGIM